MSLNGLIVSLHSSLWCDPGYAFGFDADPDPSVYFYVAADSVPDPAAKLDTDPCDTGAATLVLVAQKC